MPRSFAWAIRLATIALAVVSVVLPWIVNDDGVDIASRVLMIPMLIAVGIVWSLTESAAGVAQSDGRGAWEVLELRSMVLARRGLLLFTAIATTLGALSVSAGFELAWAWPAGFALLGVTLGLQVLRDRRFEGPRYEQQALRWIAASTPVIVGVTGMAAMIGDERSFALWLAGGMAAAVLVVDWLVPVR